MRRPPAARARRPLVPALTALAATLAVAGCGSSATPRPDVTLVPAPGDRGRTWHWTGQCTAGPAASQGCAPAGPVVGSAQLAGNGWNLGGPASAGSVAMGLQDSGAVTIDGHFARTAPCTDRTCVAPEANTWVRGFPNVLYGIDQCNAGTSPEPSPRLALPLRLDALGPGLVGVTDYSTQTAQVTYDVGYDLWLNPSGTTRPCRTQGTLEIMVWTDYDERALLPPAMQVGTAEIPVAVDGVARAGSAPWAIYASNVDRDGRTAPWGGTLWFVPPKADVVRQGRVSVDLGAVLSAASGLLGSNYGWPALERRYWLDTVSFGIEFGPHSGEPADASPTHFSAQITAYCLDLRTAPADAVCGP